MAKKQKNLFLTEEFIKAIEAQAEKRVESPAQIIEKDLFLFWAMREAEPGKIEEILALTKRIANKLEIKINV